MIGKAYRIISHRLRSQGIRNTARWIYGRGQPALTGVPPLQFSQITPDIFVGPQFGKRGKRLLEQAGITACVNLRIEYDDADYGLDFPQYCYLPTVDETAPTMEHLEQGAAFIKDVVEAGGKVYIHCAGGVGRAPTMAAAYFVSQGMTLDAALALIRSGRPFIDILPEQMGRLREFESKHG